MTNENNPNLTEIIREIHDGVAREMYCKGIDDFAKKLKAEYIKHYVDGDPYFDYIDKIAEELKKVEIQ